MLCASSARYKPARHDQFGLDLTAAGSVRRIPLGSPTITVRRKVAREQHLQRRGRVDEVSQQPALRPVTLGKAIPSQPRFGAFPVGYIVVIAKVERAGSSQSTSQSKQASSGGLLCFSHSSGEEHSGSQQDGTSEARTDGHVVRIPGPQTWGHIQQLTPADNSTPWDPKESLLWNLNIPAALPHLVYDDGTQKPGPAHGALPARAPEQSMSAVTTGDDGSDGKGTGKAAAPAPAATQPAYGVWRQARDGEA